MNQVEREKIQHEIEKIEEDVSFILQPLSDAFNNVTKALYIFGERLAEILELNLDFEDSIKDEDDEIS